MYGNYLIMKRTKKLMNDDFFCVVVLHNLLEALIEANALNAAASGLGDGSRYFVREIDTADVDGAKQRALRQERAAIDLYADGVMLDSAEEILEKLVSRRSTQ